MVRSELIDAVHTLAAQAKEGGEMAVAGILLSLAGAMCERSERELLNVCADFSRTRLERLTGEPDWSDDTLEV